MEALIKAIKEEIKQNKARDKDIPLARKAYEDLSIHSRNVQMDLTSSKLWPGKAFQASTILRGTLEINGSILLSVENGFFTAAESLLRVSIEHSINIIYIYSDTEISRSRSYLKHAILDMEEKSRKHINRAKKANDKLDLFGANRNMEFAKQLKNENPKLVKDKDLKWRNAYERFKECGFEKEYRNLFSTASDAVHSLSQDVLNRIFTFNMPPPLGKLNAEKVETYRKSLSIYFLLQALRINSLAIIRVAEDIEYKDIYKIQHIHNTVFDCILEHEMEFAETQLTSVSI